jgi:TM2 domain-containing membrane protein YozV
MYQAPPPAPAPTSRKTTASRFAWAPVALGLGSLAVGVSTGGLAWLAAPVGLAIAGGGGWWLFGKHKVERAEQQEERFEQLALAAFRQHSGTTMTKEQLVRDHRLHPDEADAVLNWLVTHDLLTANWDDYDGPLVYERSDAAAGLPMPEVRPKPVRRTKEKAGPVVVHHHHVQPPPGLIAEYKNPSLAMLLSFFWPGVGQMYAGNVGRGIAWMFGTWFGYAMLVIPGVIAHIMNVVNARETAEETNRYLAQFGHLPNGSTPAHLPPPPPPGYPPRRPPGI